MSDQKIIPEYQRKGKALMRRMEELKAQGKRIITEDNLARVTDRSRSAIPLWKRGESWPSNLEEQEMEKFLCVPPGFFRQISEGIPYETAIQFPAEEIRLAKVMERLEKLFNLRREHPQQWDHIERQVLMLADLLGKAHPEVQMGDPPTPAMLQEIRIALKIIEEEIRTGNFPDEPSFDKPIKKSDRENK